MPDTSHVYQFFSYLLHSIAKENGEGSGESTFAAVVEKIVQQTGIRDIFITNVLRKKIGTMCDKLKRTKKKSGGFGIKRLTDKWRDQTYSVNLSYNELNNYCDDKVSRT